MIKILVIEDEKRVADLLKIGLEENGYQVLVAYDGERETVEVPGRYDVKPGDTMVITTVLPDDF